MNKQRGGQFTVSGWITLLLLLVMIGESVLINILASDIHALRMQQLMHPARLVLPDTTVGGSDYYIPHAVDATQNSCNDTALCYIKI